MTLFVYKLNIGGSLTAKQDFEILCHIIWFVMFLFTCKQKFNSHD